MKIRQQAIAELQTYQVERNKNNREEIRLGEKTSLQAMMKVELNLSCYCFRRHSKRLELYLSISY